MKEWKRNLLSTVKLSRLLYKKMMSAILILPACAVKSMHPLCEHKIVTYSSSCFKAYGPYYFDTIRNWDKEKNKLLQIYGYSLKMTLRENLNLFIKKENHF